MADLNRALRCASDSDAFDSLLRAANAGCVQAQSLVGLAYQTGRGIAVDFECAAEWYRKAAGSGDSYAIANLGVMSLLGQGRMADDVEAYTWLQSAVGLGHETLRPALDLLERRITGRGEGCEISIEPLIPMASPCARAVCDPCRCDAV